MHKRLKILGNHSIRRLKDKPFVSRFIGTSKKQELWLDKATSFIQTKEIYMREFIGLSLIEAKDVLIIVAAKMYDHYQGSFTEICAEVP